MGAQLLSALLFALAAGACCLFADRRVPGGLAALWTKGRNGRSKLPLATGLGRALAAGFAYLLLALLSVLHLGLSALDGYGGDSFLTLAPAARAGLAALSLVLAATLVGLAAAKTLALYRQLDRPAPIPMTGLGLLDLTANLLLFYAFVWLSPQVYYLYYLAIFDGLAWQWVIMPAPNLFEVLGLLELPAGATLAQQGQGLLGRALLLSALTPPALFLAAALRRVVAKPATSLAALAPALAGLAFAGHLLFGLVTAGP